MFHFTGYGSYGPIEFRPLYSDINRSGFPHSDIHGSPRACRSPWLIATYYVLHRLSSPRHSPCALSSLITNLPSGSLSSSRLTYILSIVVVFTHYTTVCNYQRTAGASTRPAKSYVKKLVGAGGFEPPTLRLSSACSNQLSYAPTLVEPTRIELVTSCLQSRRSPS